MQHLCERVVLETATISHHVIYVCKKETKANIKNNTASMSNSRMSVLRAASRPSRLSARKENTGMSSIEYSSPWACPPPEITATVPTFLIYVQAELALICPEAIDQLLLMAHSGLTDIRIGVHIGRHR